MPGFPEDARASEAGWLRARGLAVPPGFSTDPWIAPTAPFARPRARVEPAALARDLPLLRDTLREAYAGWECAEPAAWDALFDSWIRHLESGGQPFAPWARWQRGFPDRHTGPWPGPPTPRPHTASVDVAQVDAWRDAEGAEHAPGAGLRGHAARARNGRGVVVLRALGEWPPPVAVRSGGRWHEVQSLAPEPEPALPDLPEARALAADVGWLRVPTPAPHQGAPDLPPREWRIVVCDLRGNRGGALGPWPDFLSRWLGPDVFGPWTGAAGWEVESPRTPALRWGLAQARLAGGEGPLSPELRASVQGVLDGLGGGPAARVVHRRAARRTWRSQSAQTTHPRLVVLVDDRCGSDGELLALLLAALPGAILAGRGTAGACGWVRPGLLWLPSAGTGFQIATARLEPAGPGVAVDGLGLPVDVLLEESPVDAAGLLALARALCS